jgi:tetratricopeptide (TPR) repeat protein
VGIALHEFDAALVGATEVLEEFPNATAAIALIFDASYELGDLTIADSALAQLRTHANSPAVTVREAKLAFVRGDVARAVALANGAAEEAAARGEIGASVAFFRYVAAEYALLSGDPVAADAGYRAALESLPGYALAIAGEGRAAVALGENSRATALLEEATAAVPRPDHVALLGDLYALAGRSADADAQYATVDFIHSLSVADGARPYDREYSLFLADHGRDLGVALSLAQAEVEMRDDVYAHDTLAWALRANGRAAQALSEVAKALSLNTVDAKLLIHAGLIELDNGLSEQGRAHLTQGLALKPAISPLVIAQAQEAFGQ